MMQENRKKIATNFVTCIMKNGNRRIAEKIAIKCFAYIKVKEEKDCTTFLEQAVRHVRPSARPAFFIKNGSSGKKTKMVPLALYKGTKLAILWITEGARKRTERSMGLRTYFELLNARVGKGYAMKKNEELRQRNTIS